MMATETSDEALDGAACGLVSTAPDGTILAVNQTFLSWTGYDRASLVGKRRLDELFTIPCRIYYETHQAPLLRMQGFANEIATDLVRNNGTVFPAFINSVEKRDDSGEAVLVRNAIFDASDRRKYERELLLATRTAEQATLAKADFLAMFAHEVRNPLSAVMLQVQILERRGVAPEQKVAMARVQTSLNKLLSLVNNMLDISKLEAGKVVLEQAEFDLRDVVAAVVHTMGAHAEKKQLPIHLHLDPRLPQRLRGDPMKLDQALTNLVGNAVKFTETGSVTIGAQLLGVAGEVAHLKLWVQDTGIGIPLDRQQDVFRDYVQGDPTIARRFGGTGLGLAITKRLLEMQNSQLQLQSEPGRGSTFAFELRLRIVDPGSTLSLH